MIKNIILCAVMIGICNTNTAYSHPSIMYAIKNASQDCVELLWQSKDKVVVASLIAVAAYVAVTNFIKSNQYRNEKLAIQDSIPELKQYISHMKRYAREVEDNLGPDIRVSLRYDNIYRCVMNHDSDEYKNIVRLYAAERKSAAIAAVSVMSFVGLCCCLYHSIVHPFR
ncbi:hypothetical protein Noda2021_00500 [Candidatus Dependentiae bacterium Noda2021]|nr:hypothetical protein Noda2021_00500 [Candidatus Dependentiae bacterium Noda2021]